jgi:outer membrane protein assembly factor BamB
MLSFLTCGRHSYWVGCLALLLAQSAPADWPHLRGPTYDGVSSETGLAGTWPAGGPPRLWSRELGQGHSGFIVAEGKVYTQRQTLSGQYVLCLDPDTGHTIWETRYDWAWQPKGAYPGPYGSPTWYGNKVYCSSPWGLVGCFDAHTGQTLWTLNVRERFQGTGTEFGYAATPLVLDERVILPVGGPNASLVALHADDGRLLWRVGSDPASYCPAMPIVFQGRQCVVGYLQNSMIIVESATGKLLFRQSLSAGYDEHSAWPLYREPHLLLLSPFRLSATCLRLEPGPGDALLSRTSWASRELCNDIVSSVLYEGHVFGFHLKELQASKHRASRGAFRCLDWSSGAVCWTTERVGQASVIVADGKLFMLNDTGALILARADAAAYEELGRTQLFDDEIFWTPPTLWHGRLFVRSPGQAVCLYVGDGDRRPAGIEAAAPPSPSHRWRFDPAWLLSREREYPNDAPTREEMTLWFEASVLCLLAAAVATMLTSWIIARLARRQVSTQLLFCGSALVLGLLGPNVFSSWADRLLFTWPASLYAAFHGTLGFCGWAQDHVPGRRGSWLARAAIMVFLLVCLGYFELCKAVGMFAVWSFLFGFLPAFPLTFLAVRAARRRQRFWLSCVWTFLAFAVFFWSCQALILWRAALEP